MEFSAKDNEQQEGKHCCLKRLISQHLIEKKISAANNDVQLQLLSG